MRGLKTVSLALGALLTAGAALAAVSAPEAEKLKTTLTPFGGEKAGNKDGTIPEWTGGYTTPLPGFVNGGPRPDPFAKEKPLFSITAKNVDQYADKLNDGTKALFKKYPSTFRVDVYPTHRTAAAPQWVYDNTFKNATRGKLKSNGYDLTGAYGGIPFPIPQNGVEAMWNHILRWRGTSWLCTFKSYLGTADGRKVMEVETPGDFQMPYYFQDSSPEEFYRTGDHRLVRMIFTGPPIRAREALTGRENLDTDKQQMWAYLTGQRRTRKVPNPCCDAPSAPSGGVSTFDESEVFVGRMDRFDWKLLGKKEMYIPYNSNRTALGKLNDLYPGQAHHMSPDWLRWELHRMWVIEATLRPGHRHQTPKIRFYLDEDTWTAVLGDRWDAKGQLWKTQFQAPIVMPDLPATIPNQAFNFYDLLSGAWFDAAVEATVKMVPRYKDSTFTPDAMAGEGVR